MIQRIPADDSRAADAKPLVTLHPGVRIPREAAAQLRVLTQLEDAAHERGRQEGYEAVVESAAGVIANAAEQARQHLEASQHDALTLAFALAERILHTTLDRNPALYADMVAESLHALAEQHRITIRAGSEAFRALDAHRDRLSIFGANTPVELEETPDALPWYTCILASSGTLELGIEAQLERLQKGITTGT